MRAPNAERAAPELAGSTLGALLTAKKPAQQGSDRDNFYLYDISFEGEVIVADARDPEHEAARALLARGIAGKLEIFDGAGKRRSTLNIEAAAKMTVSERRHGLALRRWQPLTQIANLRARPSRRTGESGEGGREMTYRDQIDPSAVPPLKEPAPCKPRRPLVPLFQTGRQLGVFTEASEFPTFGSMSGPSDQAEGEQ